MEKPYVRYEIFAEVFDVGVGVSIKRAIQSYLKANNFAGKITDFTKTSDRMSATLEMYYNGKADFNIKTLTEHIMKSGRLPLNKNMKPSLEIIPVPCDYQIITEPSPTDISWQKLVEDLNKKTNDLEKESEDYKKLSENQEGTIKRLNESLQERTGRISSLEEKLISLQSKTSSTAYSAILSLYLPQFADTLLEASSDWNSLTEKNREFFLNQENIKSIVDYLNIKYDLGLNEEQFENWKKVMEETPSWEDSEKYKEIRKEKKNMNSIDLLIKQAEEMEAPEEIINILKEKAKEKSSDVDFEKIERESKEQFEKNKKIYLNIIEDEINYGALNTIKDSSNARIEKNSYIPVVCNVIRGTNKIRITIPHIAEEELEQEIYNSVIKAIGAKERNFSEAIENNGVFEVEIENEGNCVLTEDAINNIEKNKIFNKLGIPLEVIVLSEKIKNA